MISKTEQYKNAVMRKLVKKGNSFGNLSQRDKIFMVLYNAVNPIQCNFFPNKLGIMNYRGRISELKKKYEIPIKNNIKLVKSSITGRQERHSEYWINRSVDHPIN